MLHEHRPIAFKETQQVEASPLHTKSVSKTAIAYQREHKMWLKTRYMLPEPCSIALELFQYFRMVVKEVELDLLCDKLHETKLHLRAGMISNHLPYKVEMVWHDNKCIHVDRFFLH